MLRSSLRLCSKTCQASSRIVRDRRVHSTSACKMVRDQDIAASKGEDAHDIAHQATNLIERGRWKLCNDGKGLERQFKFKTFKATWDFMNHVAAECKKQRHHPEWTNVYNKTHIRWTTHNPEGLSNKDTSMARFCDEAGVEYGELPPKDGETQIVDSHGKVEAGDCCGSEKTK